MKFLAKKIKKKIAQYERRKHRVNTIIKNTASLPRAIANKSNNATYIQVIDDKGKVIAMMNDFALTGTKTEKAHQL
jgi:ribosomal protein L18